jgi:hypothetical protein
MGQNRRADRVSRSALCRVVQPSNVRFGSLADICSAKGHVRFAPNSDRESGFAQTVMSALPPKANMCSALADVRFGPIADIALANHDVRLCAESGTRDDALLCKAVMQIRNGKIYGSRLALHSASRITACTSTAAPASRCSGRVSSRTLWLRPPTLGTNIIPDGQIRAII